MSPGLDYPKTAEHPWSQSIWQWLQLQSGLLRSTLLLIFYVAIGLLLEAAANHYHAAFDVQPWDPASGLHIVLLFGFGFRYAPAILLVPFLEDVIWPSSEQTYYLFEIFSALYMCLGYSGAAYFLLHYRPIDPRLRSLKDMLWFTTVLLGASLIISGLSLLTKQVMVSPLGPDWSQKWMQDWAGEANGIMMVAPPCLLFMRLFPWSQQHLTLQGEPPHLPIISWFRRDPTQWMAIVGGTILFTWLAYGGLQGKATDFSYVAFIPVIWIAIKWGLRQTTACLVILNICSIIFANNGVGNGDSVLAIQFGLLTVTTVGVLLGAYVTDYQTELNNRKHLEDRLSYQATHDSLTGLYNRAFLRQQLTEVEKLKEQTSNTSVLFFIDIDRFKDINDGLGHLVGDRLLSSIGKKIEYSLSEKLDPETFFTCHFGGDEFVVLIMPTLSGQTNEQAVAALAQFLCDHLAEVYEIDDYKLPITVSIGIAFSDSISEGSDALLRNADIALHKARAIGRGEYVIFDRQMYEKLMTRSQLERDLSQAILLMDEDQKGANG